VRESRSPSSSCSWFWVYISPIRSAEKKVISQYMHGSNKNKNSRKKGQDNGTRESVRLFVEPLNCVGFLLGNLISLVFQGNSAASSLACRSLALAAFVSASLRASSLGSSFFSSSSACSCGV
jgi:hypothetical protein